MNLENSVVLNADRKSLADFVISLLQQPRRIEKRYEGKNFYIDHLWIANAIEICQQRVHQNHHTMCSFEIEINFDEGYKELIFDLESFRAFHSNKKILTTGFDLSLSYLIDFANSKQPEKQDIRIQAVAPTPNLSYTASERQNPYIYFSVAYSNATWGEGMSRHIAAHIDASLEETRFMKLLAHVGKFKTTTVVGIIFPLGMIGFTWYLKTKNQLLLGEDVLKSLLNNTKINIDLLNEKINILLRADANREDFPIIQMIFFIAITTLIGFIPGICDFLLDRLTISYVALNRFTQDAYEKNNDLASG